jgi:N-acyl-L-homoserine lactone synthetase
MQTTTLSFANMHNHGELFANMLRARRELFIVHNKWNLPEALGMEYDQYDTPASRWVVVHDETGKVLAGNRLTPTTHGCGIYSYMIRDAQRGYWRRSRPIFCIEEARRARGTSGKARGCSSATMCRRRSGAGFTRN